MRVLCTGPESSGTRLLTRLVAGLGVESIHRSVPHASNWWDAPVDYDKAIVIVRDPFVTEISALDAGHPSYWSGTEAEFPYRITNAWKVIVDNLVRSGRPWIPITYEGLLLRPQFVVDNIADWLGVPRQQICEEVKDPRENL